MPCPSLCVGLASRAELQRELAVVGAEGGGVETQEGRALWGPVALHLPIFTLVE